MHANKLADAGTLNLAVVRELAPSSGPWITLLMPVHQAGAEIQQNPIRYKQLLSKLDEQLVAREMSREQRHSLLEPLRGLTDQFAPGTGEVAGKGLVAFRSANEFRYYWVPEIVEEKVAVGRHPYWKPLIPFLSVDYTFYILALSQKRIRLLKCTDRTSEEIELPDYIPTNLQEFRDTAKPDHVLDNRITAGPSNGNSKGVMFGTNTDKEKKDEVLYHFYNRVDLGIQQFLRDDPKPLVIAGVEYELPLYRSVSEYKNLVAEGVRGAADGLKGGDLHARALELMQPVFDRPVTEALALWEKLGGSNRTTANLKEVVTAAFEGRVSHLFVARNAERPGDFVEATHDVLSHKEPVADDEDLVNAAAVETLLHSGEVYVVSRNRVPRSSHMAAILRY